MGFKYVVIRMQPKKNGSWIAWDLPFIFPDKMVHKDVAEALITSQRQALPDMDFEVIAAGETTLMSHGCDGESTTLKIKSRGDVDSVLINNFPYFHGITDIGAPDADA